MFYRQRTGPGKLGEKKERPVVRVGLKLDILFCGGLVLFSKGHIKPRWSSLSCAHSPKEQRNMRRWGRENPSRCALFTLRSDVSRVDHPVATTPPRHMSSDVPSILLDHLLPILLFLFLSAVYALVSLSPLGLLRL